MSAFVHPTAVVDPGAEVGDGSRVWHWVHICATARIGRKCSIGQGVFVGQRVTVGDGCKVQNNVSLYEGVVLEDEVFCGPSMVFTNVLNPRAFIERKHEFRETRVQRGATLGANCTVICGVTIGAYALIGAGAVVTHDVPDYALVVGVPARRVGWVSRAGRRLELPESGSGTAACPEAGEKYSLQGDRLTLVPA